MKSYLVFRYIFRFKRVSAQSVVPPAVLAAQEYTFTLALANLKPEKIAGKYGSGPNRVNACTMFRLGSARLHIHSDRGFGKNLAASLENSNNASR